MVLESESTSPTPFLVAWWSVVILKMGTVAVRCLDAEPGIAPHTLLRAFSSVALATCTFNFPH